MVEYLTPTMVVDPVSLEDVSEDWRDPAVTDAPNAFVLQAATGTTSSDGVESMDSQAWTLFVPEGEREPGARDRVRFDGQVFVQDGVAIREVNPFTGWAPYAQVRLVRLEGR